MAVNLHRQWASVQPFGAPDQKTDFTPDRIAMRSSTGGWSPSCPARAESFAGHELETPWTPLRRACPTAMRCGTI